MEIRIRKIKLTTADKINISYDQMNVKSQTWDEYTMSCSDPPRPQLNSAMENLSTHVIDLCELPTSYLNKIKVTGVSFSYGGEMEVMGATITSQMHLENSNCDLNLNTPHKASAPYSPSGADPKQLLSAGCVNALIKLCDEIELYIKGERAQMNLFAVI